MTAGIDFRMFLARHTPIAHPFRISKPYAAIIAFILLLGFGLFKKLIIE